MKKRFEFGHIIGHKSPVLADAIATQRRGLGLGVLGEKREGLARGFGLVDLARFHALDEPRATVVSLVPFVHGVECCVALLDREHGAFGDKVEVFVGDDRRNLDDAIARGQQPCHLEVNPD